MVPNIQAFLPGASQVLGPHSRRVEPAGSPDRRSAWHPTWRGFPRAGRQVGRGPSTCPPACWCGSAHSPLWRSGHVTLHLFFPQLAGGVILGVALWLRHDPQTTNLLYLELGDRPAPNTFYVGESPGGPRTWLALGWGPARTTLKASDHDCCRQAVRKGFQEEAGRGPAPWGLLCAGLLGRTRPARKGSLGKRVRQRQSVGGVRSAPGALQAWVQRRSTAWLGWGGGGVRGAGVRLPGSAGTSRDVWAVGTPPDGLWGLIRGRRPLGGGGGAVSHGGYFGGGSRGRGGAGCLPGQQDWQLRQLALRGRETQAPG